IRLAENAGHSQYNSLQISADRRYMNGLKVGFAYTLSKSMDNGSDKRNVVWNTYDDSGYCGPSNYDRRHVLNVYSIYDRPLRKGRNGAVQAAGGGWKISGASFFRRGLSFSVVRTNDIAGVGDGNFGQPYNLVGDASSGAGGQFSAGAGTDQNFWFNPAAFAAPTAGTFGNSPPNAFRNPGEQQWDIALFKNFRVANTQKVQFRAEIFNFINHPNWANVAGSTTTSGFITVDPTNANFGRVISKTDARREMQLSLRYMF